MENLEDSCVLVIETTQYAGNFERELCAYITGQYGECEVGQDVAEASEEDLADWLEWFEDNTEQLPDDHGCFRPVTMCMMDNNSLEIQFTRVPPKELRDLMTERAKHFGKNGKTLGGRCAQYIPKFKVKKMEFVKRTTVITDILIEDDS